MGSAGYSVNTALSYGSLSVSVNRCNLLSYLLRCDVVLTCSVLLLILFISYTHTRTHTHTHLLETTSVIFATKIKTRTRIIGRRFQRTRTRII